MKLYNIIEYKMEQLTEDERVELYNEWAENGNYEPLHYMSDFDDIVDPSRSYEEVGKEMDDDFNKKDDYFYMDDATGLWTSTSDIDDVVCLGDIAKSIADCGYCCNDEINELFSDGCLMFDAVNDYLFEVGE